MTEIHYFIFGGYSDGVYFDVSCFEEFCTFEEAEKFVNESNDDSLLIVASRVHVNNNDETES